MGNSNVTKLEIPSKILDKYVGKLQPMVTAKNAREFYDHRYIGVDFYDREGRMQSRIVGFCEPDGSFDAYPRISDFQELWIRYNEVQTIRSIIDWIIAINRDVDIILHYGATDEDVIHVILKSINKKWADDYQSMINKLSSVNQASNWLHTLSRSFDAMKPASADEYLIEALSADPTNFNFNSQDSLDSLKLRLDVRVTDINMNKFIDTLRKFVSRIYSVLKYRGFPAAGYTELCAIDYYGTRLLDAICYVSFTSYDEYLQYILTGPFSIDGQFIITWFDESNYDLGEFYEFN